MTRGFCIFSFFRFFDEQYKLNNIVIGWSTTMLPIPINGIFAKSVRLPIQKSVMP